MLANQISDLFDWEPKSFVLPQTRILLCHRMKPVIIEFLIYLQIILFLNKTNHRLDFLCLALINQSTQVFVKKNFCRVAVYILVLAIYRNIDTIMRHTLFTTILLYIPLRYIGPDVNLSFVISDSSLLPVVRDAEQGCCMYPLRSCVKVVISVMFLKLSLHQQSLKTWMLFAIILFSRKRI